MKVKVERAMCTGHGRCWTLAPQVYEADDEGFNGNGDVIDVAPDLEEAALDGARSCPEDALKIIE